MTEGPIPDVDTKLREQAILNRSFNEETNSLKIDAIPQAIKITTSGSDTYIGLAPPGTLQSSASWQAFKYSNGIITYANGTSEFNNIATDLTALSYS